MVWHYVLKGMAVGFGAAVPVGPIGLLCIRRSLSQGVLLGLATGLGAAIADGLYGSVAAFGLTAISSFLVRQQYWMAPVGAIFFFWLGVQTFRSKASTQEPDPAAGGLAGTVVSTFLLTLTNPSTILSFAAIFAFVGFGASGNYAAASALVLGVFLGSAAWWVVLSNSVGWFRNKLNSHLMNRVNQVAGVLIIGFGTYTLLHAIIK